MPADWSSADNSIETIGGGAGTFEDRAAQIVVDQGPGNALKRREGLDVSAEKTLERLIDGAYATIQNRFQLLALVPARVSPARGRDRRCVPGACGRESQGLFHAR